VATEGIGLARQSFLSKRVPMSSSRPPPERTRRGREDNRQHVSAFRETFQTGDLDRLYETVSKVKGRIDIVFANAGVGEFVPLGPSRRAFRQTIHINVRGTLFTVQKALPLLNDGGSIISTALSRVLRVLPPSASTPRVRLPSALSCEPGLQI